MTRRDCSERLGRREREGLPLRIDPPTNSRFFRSLYIRMRYTDRHTDKARRLERLARRGWKGNAEKTYGRWKQKEVSRFVSHRRLLCLPRLQIIFPPRTAIRNNNPVYNPLQTKFKYIRDTSTPWTFRSFSIFRYLIRIVTSISLIHIPFLMENQLQLLSFFATAVINVYDDRFFFPWKSVLNISLVLPADFRK